MGLLSQHDPSARCQTVRAAVRCCYGKLQLYLNLNAGGKIQAHQSLDGLLAGVEDIDQSLVGSALELLTAVLVDMGRTQDGDHLFLGGRGMGPDTLAPLRLAVSTIFAALESMS